MLKYWKLTCYREIELIRSHEVEEEVVLMDEGGEGDGEKIEDTNED